MAERSPHAVDALDERRHVPGGEDLWGESYYLDFVAESGRLAGYTRIGLYPNLGVSWWTTALVGDGRPLCSSNDHGLPLAPDPGEGSEAVVELASGGLDVRYVSDRPLETMSVRGRAPARMLEGPTGVYARAPGSPALLELDLRWTTDGVPYHYEVTTRYEIPCRVEGEVVVGGERIAVVGQGQRDHSWGVRDWWAFGWCWAAARLDDGTRVHVADIRMPQVRVPLGYLQRDGVVRPVEALDVTESLDADGLPRRATARVEPEGLELAIEPRWFAPALLEAPDGRLSRFPRAAARFVAKDGRQGTGWVEWNQPQPGEGPGR